ncbi:hypothetical protein MRB53_025922 [Persea americana]|uniref:Uncharacterized protein n=1 Tax=Persea americana TaxID=3435 RepID=A0ACC2LHA6_PERAE|nr:hypothetical protein MRB53_025922 [Persea americana]
MQMTDSQDAEWFPDTGATARIIENADQSSPNDLPPIEHARLFNEASVQPHDEAITIPPPHQNHIEPIIPQISFDDAIEEPVLDVVVDYVPVDPSIHERTSQHQNSSMTLPSHAPSHVMTTRSKVGVLKPNPKYAHLATTSNPT